MDAVKHQLARFMKTSMDALELNPAILHLQNCEVQVSDIDNLSVQIRIKARAGTHPNMPRYFTIKLTENM